jgi:O-antigen ligase
VAGGYRAATLGEPVCETQYGSAALLSSAIHTSRPDVSRPDLLPIAGWLLVALPATVAIGPAVIDIVCSLLAVVFLAHVVREREVAWLREPWVRVILALWAFTVVRAVFAGPPWVNVGLALGWVRYPLLVVAMSTWILRHETWRERLLVSTAVVCGFLALDALFQAAVGFDIIGRPIYQERLTATMNRPRLGITLAWLFLPAAFGLLQRDWTMSAMALALGCLAIILMSGDRLAFLFAVTGLVLVAAILPDVRRRAWRPGLAAVALIGCVLLFKPSVYGRQVSSTLESFRDIGATHYGMIWKRGVTIARHNPLFGVGMNRYRDICDNPAYGPIATTRNNWSACALHVHHLYLEWLVEGGLVGCAGFVAAMLLIGRRLWSTFPRLRGDYLFIALVVTVGLRLFPASTAMSLTRSWFSMPLWLVIGWALALAMSVGKQRPAN